MLGGNILSGSAIDSLPSALKFTPGLNVRTDFFAISGL
jgi:hypothetical protein